jgi:hypothetical protein
MKKLFRNYNFEFDKNETKILTAFCKQVIKQTETDEKFFAEAKAFKSILEKLNSSTDSIKLTKDEYFRLKNQLSENTKFMKKEAAKGWFFKKWMYKSMLSSYSSILEKYFSE